MEEDTYLKGTTFGQDHICVSDMTASERHNMNYGMIARRTWNNLRSPSNPRNYFHGKLMPIRTDENDNLVFVYSPSEYEQRWLDEGIDLTK